MKRSLDLPNYKFYILIIEDDGYQLERFATLIGRIDQSFVVHSASTAEQAEACLVDAEEPYHVALVDMKLYDDEEAGLSLIKQIRQTDQTTDIIVITQYGGLENAHKAIEAGANQYLSKSLPEFERTLTRVVRERVFRASAYRCAQIYTEQEQNTLRRTREMLEEMQAQPPATPLSTFHSEIIKVIRMMDSLDTGTV